MNLDLWPRFEAGQDRAARLRVTCHLQLPHKSMGIGVRGCLLKYLIDQSRLSSFSQCSVLRMCLV